MTLSEQEGEHARDLVKHYEETRWMYEVFADRVSRFLAWKIREFFNEAWWPFLHLPQARAKSPSSLLRNLLAEKPRYRVPLSTMKLEDVGDLAAVRMIFYFVDDLEKFVEFAKKDLLESWFGAPSSEQLDFKRPSSLDKKYEAFGYASVHFPVVNDRQTVFGGIATAGKPASPPGIRCEVQLRTILQHAWAEGEHDLRYKGGELVNAHDKRQWGRVAALVDCADGMMQDLKQRRERHTAVVPDSKPPIPPLGTYVSLHEPGDVEPAVDRDLTLFDVDRLLGAGFKEERLAALEKRVPSLRLLGGQHARRSLTHDSLGVRVTSWNRERVGVQPCLYSDAIASTHVESLKMTVGDKPLTAHALGTDGGLLDFDVSPMANPLGVACMVRDRDKHWLLCRRGARINDPGVWGCSAAGALEWNELAPGGSLIDWGRNSIARKARRILGIELTVPEIQYAGTARYLQRGGLPQMFFVVFLSRAREEIRGLFEVHGSDANDDLGFADTSEAITVRDGGVWNDYAASAELREALRRALAFAGDDFLGGGAG